MGDRIGFGIYQLWRNMGKMGNVCGVDGVREEWVGGLGLDLDYLC